MRTRTLIAFITCSGLLAACAEVDDRNLDETQASWSTPPEQIEIEEPIDYRPHPGGNAYGLPREGEPSIADLLSLMPPERVGRDDVQITVAADDVPTTDQCPGGTVNTSDQLPATIEAVVTLHPRQYLKVPICNQDERNYGSFTIEDDSGGILFLRDSRVAEYTFGDRVRIDVRGVTPLYGDPAQAAIIVGRVDVLPPLLDENGEPVRTVYYRERTQAFDADIDGDPDTNDLLDVVGKTFRIEGYVLQQPTSENFNAMIVSDAFVEPPPVDGEPDALCTELCRSPCRRVCASEGNALCINTVCPSICLGNNNEFDEELLPQACWSVNVDQEVGRRGFSPVQGTHLSVTGPVVQGFGGAGILMQRLGQIEYLD